MLHPSLSPLAGTAQRGILCVFIGVSASLCGPLYGCQGDALDEVSASEAPPQERVPEGDPVPQTDTPLSTGTVPTAETTAEDSFEVERQRIVAERRNGQIHWVEDVQAALAEENADQLASALRTLSSELGLWRTSVEPEVSHWVSEITASDRQDLLRRVDPRYLPALFELMHEYGDGAAILRMCPTYLRGPIRPVIDGICGLWQQRAATETATITPHPELIACGGQLDGTPFIEPRELVRGSHLLQCANEPARRAVFAVLSERDATLTPPPASPSADSAPESEGGSVGR